MAHAVRVSLKMRTALWTSRGEDDNSRILEEGKISLDNQLIEQKE
jgi:hypothetical protein